MCTTHACSIIHLQDAFPKCTSSCLSSHSIILTQKHPKTHKHMQLEMALGLRNVQSAFVPIHTLFFKLIYFGCTYFSKRGKQLEVTGNTLVSLKLCQKKCERILASGQNINFYFNCVLWKKSHSLCLFVYPINIKISCKNLNPNLTLKYDHYLKNCLWKSFFFLTYFCLALFQFNITSETN